MSRCLCIKLSRYLRARWPTPWMRSSTSGAGSGPSSIPSAKHITGRIVRLASLFQQSYGDAFAEVGLQNGDYGVLAALRRAGAPFQLTPTDLARHRMMTSGGMTAAIDRLERKGLVSRLPNPNDRRGNLVKLTDEGRRIVDAAMNVHADSRASTRRRARRTRMRGAPATAAQVADERRQRPDAGPCAHPGPCYRPIQVHAPNRARQRSGAATQISPAGPGCSIWMACAP